MDSSENILIVDFGSQVTQLIARRVRESGVFCEIISCDLFTKSLLESSSPKGVILSGGPMSTVSDDYPRAPDFLFNMGIPVLGICYGQQIMVQQLGGQVETSENKEFGRAKLSISRNCRLFNSNEWQVGSEKVVWMSHGDRVERLPEGFFTVGSSDGSPFAAIADDERRLYGVQFHPEVMHTEDGSNLLKNFTHSVAGCSGAWSMSAFRKQKLRELRKEIGDKKIICGISGGVDSSVVAVLLHEAIGSQLTCVFVDTGMMRDSEADEVLRLFRDHYNVSLVHRDASDLFIRKLKSVTDPEEKRKIIGTTFIDVFEEEAEKIGGADLLAQGTLYPDVIESVAVHGGPTEVIKSHHNVGGLPDRMDMKLVEPVRDLFKDEVRSLGKELGLPEQFIKRHPFPGPGLAIRIPGEVTFEKLEILRKADKIYLDQICRAGLYDQIWQAFAVLLPVKTVGVMGDARTYDYVCALRAVTSTDGMTADFYPFTAEFLGETANSIINKVRGINRVVYDITSKPPGTIEWE